MASIHKEALIAAAPTEVWAAIRDVGAVHRRLAPGFVTDTNVVLWYMSPAYHLPRDEDGLFVNPDGRVSVRGVAMTTWCGFELRPRNVFDKSPLYP